MKIQQELKFPASGVHVALEGNIDKELMIMARQVTCKYNDHQSILETFNACLSRAAGMPVSGSSSVEWAETDLSKTSIQASKSAVNYVLGFCNACDDLSVLDAEVPSHEMINAVLSRNNSSIRISDGCIVSAGQHVPSPIPGLSASASLVAALNDAETLIQQNRPENAVDRVHTALHAYLRSICNDHGIPFDPEAKAPKLYKEIRAKHPNFATAGAHSKEIHDIAQSMAAAVEALSTVRNRASLAHGGSLLDKPEAYLAVNAARTIFQYLQSRAA